MIRHGFGCVLAAALLAGAAACSTAPALTDKDKVLIADIVNETGDAAFDDAIKPAVIVALQQTPYLNPVPDPSAQRALRQMQRPANEAVTGDVARDLCKRAGGKAVVQGSLAASGSAFIVKLEARNCETGASMATAEAHANNKEEVIAKTGEAALALRKRLGEPADTLAKFNAPLARATSAMPEVLANYGRGLKVRTTNGDDAALPFFLQAAQKDPAFGLAAAKAAVVAANTGRIEEARELTRVAYAQREPMTEYERLYITWNHAVRVLNDPNAVKAALEQLVATYPRDFAARNNFGVYYNTVGELDEALKQYKAATEIAPEEPGPLSNTAYVLLMLARYDEASDMVDRTLAIRPDANLAIGRWVAARVAGLPKVAEYETAARKFAGPDQMTLAEATLAAWSGRFQDFERMEDELVARARATGGADLANQVAVGKTITLAAYRQGRDIKALAAAAEKEKEPGYLIQQLSALAMLGQTDVVRAGLKRLSADKANEALGPPLIVSRAYLLAEDGKTPEAIASLQAALVQNPRARDMHFFMADLKERAGDLDGALTSYRTVINSLTYLGPNPLIPSSRMRVAKILLRKGDKNGAKEQLDVLLEQWKNADAGFPGLAEVRVLRGQVGS